VELFLEKSTFSRIIFVPLTICRQKNRLIKHNLLLFGWQQLDIDASVFTSCQKAGGGGS